MTSAPGARLDLLPSHRCTWPYPATEMSLPLPPSPGGVTGRKEGTLCFTENLLPFNSMTPTEDHSKAIDHDHHILIITQSLFSKQSWPAIKPN